MLSNIYLDLFKANTDKKNVLAKGKKFKKIHLRKISIQKFLTKLAFLMGEPHVEPKSHFLPSRSFFYFTILWQIRLMEEKSCFPE